MKKEPEGVTLGLCAMPCTPRTIVYYAVRILCTIIHTKIFVIMHHLVANDLPWIKLQSKWKKSRKALPNLYYLGSVRHALPASRAIVYYAVLILCTFSFVIMHRLVANNLLWILSYKVNEKRAGRRYLISITLGPFAMPLAQRAQ